MSPFALSVVLVRFVALILFAVAICWTAFSYMAFNASAHMILAETPPASLYYSLYGGPAVLFVLSIILSVFSRPVARFLSGGLEG